MIETTAELIESLKAIEQKLLKEYDIVDHPVLIGDMYEGLSKHWQDLNVDKNETAWGGEPGADLLTHYLKPETLLLYTHKKNKLAADWTRIPNEQGILKTYEKFWKEEPTDPMGYAPPLLLYADLLQTHDPRCLDTANIIYEKYLKNEFA